MHLDLIAALELPRWLDLVGLGLVGLFLVLGIRRGLWWQLVRLLGLAATFAAARALVPRLSDGLAAALPSLDPRIANGIVWVVIIALGLAVIAFVGRLGKETIQVAQFGLLDRAGGAVAGALSGALLHGALVLILVLLGPLDWSREALRDTRSARLYDTLGRRVSLLDDAYAAEVLREE
jgi:uncharacterized membrane protein required for colicin V production